LPFSKNFSTFGSVINHFQQRLYARPDCYRERRFVQPHYSSLINVLTPYGNIKNPSDGVCSHFLRRGFTKPNKIQFNCSSWSADARWLVLGTQTGELALWEGEALKVHKVISIPAHKEYFDDGSGRVKENVPITCLALKKHGSDFVTGDQKGLIQYCDETFKNILVIKEAHSAPVKGLSFSPLGSKLASCSDDGKIHIWAGGRDKPELTLLGHQNDVKCIDWHPFRALIVSGSRDSTLKLWDPKQGICVRLLYFFQFIFSVFQTLFFFFKMIFLFINAWK
jgi:polyadenylation factor subunit 2